MHFLFFFLIPREVLTVLLRYSYWCITLHYTAWYSSHCFPHHLLLQYSAKWPMRFLGTQPFNHTLWLKPVTLILCNWLCKFNMAMVQPSHCSVLGLYFRGCRIWICKSSLFAKIKGKHVNKHGIYMACYRSSNKWWFALKTPNGSRFFITYMHQNQLIMSIKISS